MSSLNISIIYEDNNFLVINKPAGLAIHKDSFNKEEVLTDWIVEKYPECEGVGEPMKLQNGEVIDRPGIVHRLDKGTTGALIIAKNQTTYLWLKEAFQRHQVKKVYQAIVYGHFKDEKGIVDLPIGRNKNDPRKRLAGRGASGVLRDALTEYKVLQDFGDYSYLEVFPKTGRTHQIRVHLKAISHPIVCDSLYAEGQKCLPGLDRPALHAGRLEVETPDGQKLVLEAPLPTDFQSALEYLRKL